MLMGAHEAVAEQREDINDLKAGFGEGNGESFPSACGFVLESKQEAALWFDYPPSLGEAFGQLGLESALAFRGAGIGGQRLRQEGVG